MSAYVHICEWINPFSGETHTTEVLGFVRPDDAATHAIMRHEWDMAEFPIASGRESVFVTVKAEDNSITRYEISGDSAPRYFAVPLAAAITAEAGKEPSHA